MVVHERFPAGNVHDRKVFEDTNRCLETASMKRNEGLERSMTVRTARLEQNVLEIIEKGLHLVVLCEKLEIL